MPANPNSDSFAIRQFVENLPDDIRGLAEAVQKVVLSSMPRTIEIVYHGALGYSPTGRPFDRLVYILPSSRHVTLGFFFGGTLPDPKRRLEGEGKRMRHLKARTADEAADPYLRRLVQAAHHQGKTALETFWRRRKLGNTGRLTQPKPRQRR